MTMFSKRRRKTVIGLIIEDIYTDFSNDIIKSIKNAIPADSDIRLMVFGGRYDVEAGSGSRMSSYKTVYNSVFRLANICELDGLIVHLGNSCNKGNDPIRSEFFDVFGGIPKVFICADSEKQLTVNYDNETGIREAVDYLVNVNGSSNICMLGGRDDNIDAIKRKQIFINCLEEHGVEFVERNYEPTDMSMNCVEEAGRLLDRNPFAEAVFCVNDAVASGLYAAMQARGLKPGRDILVFGFDNTHLAGEMIPSLTSIGSEKETLGQKAFELLMKRINGEKCSSALIPTRLYGRESFDYEMYEYTYTEMIKGNNDFIYKMFDDCFYRYKTENFGREPVNLRRLFFEIISGMLRALKRRYMSNEEFGELCRMVDIFFDKGAMEYTDAEKLIGSVERLQVSMNTAQRLSSTNIIFLNRLFLRMKDNAICAISAQKVRQSRSCFSSREKVQEFLIEGTAYTDSAEENLSHIIKNLGRLGINNAAFYLYEKPFEYCGGSFVSYPETIDLRCAIKSGELYSLSKGRHRCVLKELFRREDMLSRYNGYAIFPVFYRELIYGLLICELTEEICSRGEYFSVLLGRAIHINETDSKLRSADKNIK